MEQKNWVDKFYELIQEAKKNNQNNSQKNMKEKVELEAPSPMVNEEERTT